jgi:hypothetical protein
MQITIYSFIDNDEIDYLYVDNCERGKNVRYRFIDNLFSGFALISLVDLRIKSSKQVLKVKGFIDKDGIKSSPIVARKGTLIP